ncbi:hypothetical protein DFH11DRAFT_1252098 [Phellopilus nigrolimitatus]|nr:hypothetical protein DFH11DRAFT_1252098 [Phellopilus nigrolimitatus]
MPEQTQYAPAAHVPFIKSPSLRIPRPIEAPPDIHPLPDDINAYFVYPFTLEPHVFMLESSRRSTLAAHTARHEAYLKQRTEDKDRRRRDALRRIAPGFEPQGAPLVPVRMSEAEGGSGGKAGGAGAESGRTFPEGGERGHVRQRSVMDDLVDHLAALDAANTTAGSSSIPGDAGAGNAL